MSFTRSNSIKDEYSELMELWDYSRNVGIDPSSLTPGSNKSVWWKCDKGHNWQAPPHRMKKSKSCPYCTGGLILSGYNDLVTVNPNLAREWDYERNSNLDPNTVGPNSNKKVYWICKKGHNWEAVIAHRNRGVGCPICSNKRIIAGVNDFATIHPELITEWNFDKNIIKPDAVAPSAGKSVWWKCKNGHEYETTVNKRHNGAGCPYCNGNRLLSGFNDLQTLYPNIAESWDYERNGELKPDRITAHNNTRIWWKCKNGHSWLTSVDNRTKGKGCPHCSGRIITAGCNDFKSLHPELATEWDYDKNVINPQTIGGRSDIYAWWRCNICGHSWQASVSNRVAGTGCPKCARRTHSSFPEQAIYFYVQKMYPDAINGYKELFDNQSEIDIFIPSLNMAIEYDGKAWHKGSISHSKEINKFQICKKYSIKLIRIKEKFDIDDKATCDVLIESKYDYNHYETLHEVLIELKKYLPLINDFDLNRDRNQIWDGYYSVLKKNSLAEKYPNIAAEWHSTKNGFILPEMMTASTSEKVWWKCSSGHEWEARVSDRVKGNNCPFCSNKQLLKGYNDLETVFPNLAKEWDADKNNGVLPSQIITGSRKKVWWRCRFNHRWQAYVYSRTAGTGCPYCSGRNAISGENDLLTLRPDIAKDWDYHKNTDLVPNEWTVGSGKKVWWRCTSGHEKYTAIFLRVDSNGCPECNKIKRSNK